MLARDQVSLVPVTDKLGLFAEFFVSEKLRRVALRYANPHSCIRGGGSYPLYGFYSFSDLYASVRRKIMLSWMTNCLLSLDHWGVGYYAIWG